MALRRRAAKGGSAVPADAGPAAAAAPAAPGPRAGSGGHPPLLDPRLLARLDALQLGTRRRLAGQFAGEHRSTRRGSSPDFADYREYHPGDDFRRIDYFLYARLDVLLIKLFEAEEDLHVRLLVDTSGSMAGAKLDTARRAAAALGHVALSRRDTVSVHTVGAGLEGAAPRFAGHAARPALFAHLSGLEAGGATPFAAAATRLLSRRGPAGLTVVLSDLLTPEWEPALRRLPARGADLVVVHVLAPDDLRPTVEGDVELVDRETGERVAVSLAPEAADQYRRRAEAWAAEVAGRARHLGAAYVRLLTTDDLETALLGWWREAGVFR